MLERSEGNIVIYHSSGLNEVVTDIQLLGGASCVLMNHEHESVGGTPSIDIPFWIHRDDSKESIERYRLMDSLNNVRRLQMI